MPVLNTTQIYHVPIISTDLRKDETINQIVDALTYLEQITDEIFGRISKEVNEKKQRLQPLCDRIALCRAKVDKLKGSSKATKVFASAKYPVSEGSDSQAIFAKSSGNVDVARSNYHLHSKHPAVDETVLKEKLKLYDVKLKRGLSNSHDAEEGLGSLPKVIPSIDSLLLFNTTENPYKKYTMLDTLGVVTKTRTALDQEVTSLAEAPESMTATDDHIQKAETFFYIPNMGDVPEIAVPDMLPELSGIAKDLSYQADRGPSIAPSVFSGNMPDLPSVIPDTPSAVAPTSTQPSPPEPPTAPPPQTPLSSPPPPPPPPIAPPPVPPPAPPVIPNAPLSAATPTKEESINETAQKPRPDNSGGRNDLLQSIRNSGGVSKLKSAKDRKIKKKQEKEVKAETGGDMMSDLVKTLALRRRGIAGNSSEGSKKSTSGSAMDKVSEMIPSPPKPDSVPETDEDDWNM